MKFRALLIASMGAFAVCGGAAIAGPRDDVLQSLGKCAAIADGAQRLSCYDSLAPRVRDAMVTPPQTATHPPTKGEQESWFGFDISNLFSSTPAQQTTPEKFGADRLPLTHEKIEKAEKTVDEITVPVTDVTYNPYGKFVVFLKNGQIWKQLPGDADRAHFPRKLDGVTVTISRGFIGSYNLTIGNSNKVYKVSRVK
jgi:hypothetical protein